jgi:hypothetical protein
VEEPPRHRGLSDSALNCHAPPCYTGGWLALRLVGFPSAATSPCCGAFSGLCDPVPGDAAVEVEFAATNPGASLVHCHMQQHMDYGFSTLIEYV